VHKLITLGLKPPTWVIIAQEYTLVHFLQPIITLSPVPTSILPLEDVPQRAHDGDIPNEVTHSLT